MFGQKNRNICETTFSPKILKWQKCHLEHREKNVFYIGTFAEKIRKFLYVKPRFLALKFVYSS